MSARLPQSKDLSEFWSKLIDGKELIQRFSDSSLPNDPNYIQAKGVLEDIDKFDAPLFGISNREAECMDPQQRLLLECSWEALENAGYDPEQTSYLIGVYASSSISTYFIRNLLPEFLKKAPGSQDESLMLMGTDKDFLATRVSYKLNLKGPSKSIQTACSSSLVAAHDASQALLNYECDIALVGGVSITCPQFHGYFYSKDSINSPTGECKPFDSDANGTVIGNGAGVVVLKRLEDAISDNDTIYGTILSSSVNNDGRDKIGYTAPSIAGQAYAIESALMNSGVSPENISFIEAHGTGTKLGDPIEIAALKKVYKKYTQKKEYCALGSVKANIGHLDAAAGIVGLIKSLLILKNKEIPPLCHFEEPNPELDLKSSPFYLTNKKVKLDKLPHPIRGSVSSFGIGGTNAHIVLEQAPSTKNDERIFGQPFLIPISANTPEAYFNLIKKHSDYCDNFPSSLHNLSYTLQVGRKSLKFRKCFLASSVDELKKSFELQDHPQTATSPKSLLLNFKDIKNLDLDNLKLLQEASPLFNSFFKSILDDYAQISNWPKYALTIFFQIALGKVLKELVPSSPIITGSGSGRISAGHLNDYLTLDTIHSRFAELNSKDFNEQQIGTQFFNQNIEDISKELSTDKNNEDKFEICIGHESKDFSFKPLDFFLKTIKNLWEQGTQVNWEKFNKGFNFSRIPAPTYSFEKHSYWVPSPKESLQNFDNEPKTQPELKPTSLYDALEKIWKKTLRLENINKDSDFFELGGDSLLGLEIADEIRNFFEVDFALQSLFEFPKLNEQVSFLENLILENIDQISEKKAEEIIQIIEGE